MAIPYKKVMVTLDGSDLALQALPQAEAVAASFGCSLILFRVIRPESRQTAMVISEEDQKIVEAGIAQHRSQRVQAAKEALRAVAETLTLPGDQVQIAVEIGEAAEEIVHYAAVQSIDLLVMCTHGRSGMRRLVRGSIAEKVLHDAGCPVLLVRAH